MHQFLPPPLPQAHLRPSWSLSQFSRVEPAEAGCLRADRAQPARPCGPSAAGSGPEDREAARPRMPGHRGWSPEGRTGVETATRPSATEKAVAAKRPRRLPHFQEPPRVGAANSTSRDKPRPPKLG